MTDVSIPGVSRQQLKAIKNMGLPELRKWLLAYSWNVYNIGVADCKDALQAKIDLHKAGKLARRLNTEMKRYQAAVDTGADYGILLDAADEIMDTVEKLKDVKHDLVKTGSFERDIAISSKGKR